MNCTNKILEDLIVDNPNEKILFEQYKLYVEMANDVSKRRDKTNKFYLSIISLLMALFSTITSITKEWTLFLIPFTIMVLFCLIWRENIKSYSTLNRGKFDVINEIEKELPVKGFTIEWDLIKTYNYKELTKVEQNIPLIILIISVTSIGLLLINLLIQKGLCFT